jgi:hypothetical protein
MTPGTYERTVTIRGREMRRKTVVWRTVHNTIASGSQYFIGKTWISDRLHYNDALFAEIDAAIKEEFGE